MKKEVCLINAKSKKMMDAQGAFNSENQRNQFTPEEA
jgi:hypothetical protein